MERNILHNNAYGPSAVSKYWLYNTIWITIKLCGYFGRFNKLQFTQLNDGKRQMELRNRNMFIEKPKWLTNCNADHYFSSVRIDSIRFG